MYKVCINSDPGSFYFNFSNFKLREFELSKSGIHIYKYNHKYDFSIDCDINILKKISSINIIQSWAENISDELSVKMYYCGYEPAIDMETTFFTGKNLGPLKW